MAQALIARYGWGLLRVEELAELIADSRDAEALSAQSEERALRCYAGVLFQSCHQGGDHTRQTQAYVEVHRFLYRAAYKRWSDLPQETIEDVVQQALLLVYEQIDRCSNPESFLSFAFWKLRQAAKGAFRRQDTRDDPGEDEFSGVPDRTELIDDQLQAERIRALLDAINRLPDERSRRIYLLKLDGSSDSEIGEQLGITANYVRVLRNHAKKRLQQDVILRRYIEDDRSDKG
jgi:RNA polymerase sigma factor (sigma-70 family)